MPDMSAQEIWDFLRAGTRTAHVGTTRPDGRPHVKPVWFVLDGQPGDFQLVFTTYADSVKGRSLRRDSQVAVSVDDPAPPYSFVIVEGTALVSDDLCQVRAAARHSDYAERLRLVGGGAHTPADLAPSLGRSICRQSRARTAVLLRIVCQH